MKVVATSRIAGEFWGYEYDRVYFLEDGTSWRQTHQGSEPVYRERPSCKILFAQDRGLYWLDVEGTSGVVQVEKVGRKRWARPGVF